MLELECDGLFSDGIDVTATYTASDGTGGDIQVIFAPGEHGSRPESIINIGGMHVLPVERDFRSNFSGGTRRIATVLVQAADIAAPAYGDTIAVDGVTWVVREVFDDA